jgi:hypothetical protein
MSSHTEFVITGTRKRSPYLPVGRALLEGEELAIYITDIGRFTANPAHIRVVMLLGGYAPVTCQDGKEITAERREGGRGLWISIGADRYVIPGRSLVPVLEGKTRKAVVMRYEGE